MLLRAEAPSGKGLVDPIGDLLKAAKQAGLPKAGDSKYDPLPGLLQAQALQRGDNDALGNFVRYLTHVDLRNVPGKSLKTLSIKLTTGSFQHLCMPVMYISTHDKSLVETLPPCTFELMKNSKEIALQHTYRFQKTDSLCYSNVGLLLLSQIAHTW